jgi:CPA2 family monovalent cation:H+ antiporter-2
VIAIDDKAQITELVRYVRHKYPQLHVVARAVDRNHVYDLWAAGCRDIIRETYDSSIRMGRSAYEALGATKVQAEAMKLAYDAMDRKSMLALAEHYDPDIPAFENEVYVAKVREMTEIWEADLGLQMAAILAKA